MSTIENQVSKLTRSKSFELFSTSISNNENKSHNTAISNHLDLILFSPNEVNSSEMHLTQVCDAFFNPKELALYESLLSAIMLKHKASLIPVINKVFLLLQPGLEKVKLYFQHKSSNDLVAEDTLSEKMYTAFTQRPALPKLYGELVKDPASFFEILVKDLASTAENTFFKKLAICREYLSFYMGRGSLKPMGNLTVEKKWEEGFDVNAVIGDVVEYRSNWFANISRIKRSQFALDNSVSKNIGYLPPEDYDSLSEQDKRLLVDSIPEHPVGGYLFVITTKGDFTKSGSYNHHMPQLCGPSGTTAMYLGLANQANLTSDEKQLYSFIMSLYTVAFGGHSIDETFIMGSESGPNQFNNYQRGDYSSIIPTIVKESIEWEDLYDDIQKLDQRIFHSNNIEQSNSLVNLEN